jgi:RHS repeat-associated protein
MTMAAQLSENSHQGFDGIKAALCLGSMKAKSNTASGMPVCLWRNGIGSRSSGKERDAETGLDYFGARYYSGAQGRFITPDPLMASAKISNPQTWNRYIYALNNPLLFVDPDGLDVDEACAESDGCQITLKVNIVYDSKLSKTERKKFKKEQVAKAKEDYANSNIELVFTESEGSRDGRKITGTIEGALNVFVTEKSPNNDKAGSSGLNDSGGDVAAVYTSKENKYNVGPLSGNTLEHEIAHGLLGHNKMVEKMETTIRFLANPILDGIVNTRLSFQQLGLSQDAMRSGTMTKQYAAPTNGAANKPSK